MRKVLPIVITVVLLASGMQLSIDRHYCGGILADVRISLTGKMASCGMDQSESGYQNYPSIDNKCCEDQVSFYSIVSNYFPEYFKLIRLASERDISIPQLSVFPSCNSYNSDSINWVLPPGFNLRAGLTLAEICVFRI
jgi:hypothetical protein